MRPREQFINALNIGPPHGHVPTFELVFFLTMEKFGRVFPGHRRFSQWDQMSQREREAHIADAAEIYILTARTYGHSAIFVHPFDKPGGSLNLIAERIRELTGDEFFLMRHAGATFGIPDGNHMMEFAYRLADDPKGLHAEAAEMVQKALARSAT